MLAAHDLTSDSAAPRMPAWLASCLFHVVFMLLLAYFVRPVPRGAAEEPGRMAGIVLRSSSDDGAKYEGEEDFAEEGESAASESSSSPSSAVANDVLAALPASAGGVDLSSALPQAPSVVGGGALEGGGVGGAGDLAAGGGGQPRSVEGGRARTGVYGLEGEGNKFIYIFDRSVSMSGAPLRSAKTQLLASLQSLKGTHQFQIIFFNHNPQVFDLTGGQNRIPFANDRTRQLAGRFVAGITADGGTDRYAALLQGVGMRPDVIFFLTDADDPMSADEVEQIRRRNRRNASINVIEFGEGPGSGDDNFLKQLARQNDGGYVYVDVLQLGK